MDKYLVDVYLPASGEHYDVYLPTGVSVGEATVLIINIIESLSRNNFKGTTNTVLVNANNGDLLDRDATINDVGIRNSSRLILV